VSAGAVRQRGNCLRGLACQGGSRARPGVTTAVVMSPSSGRVKRSAPRCEGSTEVSAASPRPAPQPLERQAGALPPVGRAFLDGLLRLRIVTAETIGKFYQEHAAHLAAYDSAEALGQELIEARLLTQYQFERVMAGTTHGLVLGNHRVLNPLGSGAMG